MAASVGVSVISVVQPAMEIPECLSVSYRSLQTQTDVNWDWTIWFRDARTDIPTDLTRDPRVVVKTEQQTTIAALKKKAYASAAGEYLVGLDAGDEFADNAIAAIRDASERPAAIYSDFAICRKNGSSLALRRICS
jgi:hypothetical protein